MIQVSRLVSGYNYVANINGKFILTIYYYTNSKRMSLIPRLDMICNKQEVTVNDGILFIQKLLMAGFKFNNHISQENFSLLCQIHDM